MSKENYYKRKINYSKKIITDSKENKSTYLSKSFDIVDRINNITDIIEDTKTKINNQCQEQIDNHMKLINSYNEAISYLESNNANILEININKMRINQLNKDIEHIKTVRDNKLIDITQIEDQMTSKLNDEMVKW
jgi:hypothetical protein